MPKLSPVETVKAQKVTQFIAVIYNFIIKETLHNITLTIIKIIIIQFNSVQFNRYLLTCRLSSTSDNYKGSTKTQMQHKNSTNTQKQSTKHAEKKAMRQQQEKSNIREVLTQINLNPGKIGKVIE
jgi:hypothetical protein